MASICDLPAEVTSSSAFPNLAHCLDQLWIEILVLSGNSSLVETCKQALRAACAACQADKKEFLWTMARPRFLRIPAQPSTSASARLVAIEAMQNSWTINGLVSADGTNLFVSRQDPQNPNTRYSMSQAVGLGLNKILGQRFTNLEIFVHWAMRLKALLDLWSNLAHVQRNLPVSNRVMTDRELSEIDYAVNCFDSETQRLFVKLPDCLLTRLHIKKDLDLLQYLFGRFHAMITLNGLMSAVNELDSDAFHFLEQHRSLIAFIVQISRSYPRDSHFATSTESFHHFLLSHVINATVDDPTSIKEHLMMFLHNRVGLYKTLIFRRRRQLAR